MNKKEFKKFKKLALKWRDKLGNHDWCVTVSKDSLDGNQAETWYDNQNRWANISIDNNSDFTEYELEVCAIHEHLELVLADLRELLYFYYEKKLVDRNMHRAIRKLENALK